MLLIRTIILSILSPILVLYAGLRSRRIEYKSVYMMVFFAVYGGSMVVLDNNGWAISDGGVHLNRLKDYYVNASFEEILEWTKDVMLFKLSGSRYEDLYIHLVHTLVGTVLKAPWLLFYLVSLVYGYFFVQTFLKVQGFVRKRSPLIVILLTILFLTKGLTGIHSIRNWTAMWISLFIFIKVFESGNKKLYFYLLLVPLVHFSYALMALPLVLSSWLKSSPKFIFLLFIFSLLTSVNDLGSFGKKSVSSENIAQNKISSYSITDKRAEAFQQDLEGSSLHRRLMKESFHRHPTNLILIIIVLASGYLRKAINQNTGLLLTACILIMSLSNFSIGIASLSTRSLIFGMILLFMSLIHLLSNSEILFKSKGFKYTIYLLILFYTPYYAYEISSLLRQSNFLLITGLSFLSHLGVPNYSIMDVLKGNIF